MKLCCPLFTHERNWVFSLFRRWYLSLLIKMSFPKLHIAPLKTKRHPTVTLGTLSEEMSNTQLKLWDYYRDLSPLLRSSQSAFCWGPPGIPLKTTWRSTDPTLRTRWSDWLAGSVSKRCAPNWLEPGRRIAFHTLLKYSPGRAWKGYCFPKCLILRSREGAAEWRRRVRDAVSKNPETSSRKKLTVRKAAPLLLFLLLLLLLFCWHAAFLLLRLPNPLSGSVTITGRQVSNPVLPANTQITLTHTRCAQWKYYTGRRLVIALLKSLIVFKE